MYLQEVAEPVTQVEGLTGPTLLMYVVVGVVVLAVVVAFLRSSFKRRSAKHTGRDWGKI